MNLLRAILLNLLMITALFSSDFEQDVIKLIDADNFNTKQTVIKELAAMYQVDPRLSLMLSKMLEGALYMTEGKTLVYAQVQDKPEQGIKALLNNEIVQIPVHQLVKVTINNKLRNIIKSSLVTLNLSSKDKYVRLASAKEMMETIEESNVALVKSALEKENDKDVNKLLNENLLILKAKFASGEEQLQAVNALSDSLSVKALQILNELQNTQDKKLNTAVISSIKSIEMSRKMYSFVETAFFGVSLGSVLLLAAIGLAITFGVMKIINMAHGELMMLGAYATYSIQQLFPQWIEYSVLLAIPVAFLVSALVGMLIERCVLQYLYGRPLEALLATFGISLILQQIVRSIYSPLNQEVKTPQWMSGALEINGALSLTYNRLYIVVFALMVFTFVVLILKKTSLGLKVRAVSQNRAIARAMGIKTHWVDAITFGIGSGIAGVAGVALSQLTNVGPNLGQAYIVDSFMVVVFGGVGNLWGTLIAALTLGEINKFIEPLAGAVLAKVIILVFIILFIQKRPRGLFPQKGRDAED